ncbi:MAG: mechanosensitive ion channel domain-containing protein [Burkholderiaceae bacterium]
MAVLVALWMTGGAPRSAGATQPAPTSSPTAGGPSVASPPPAPSNLAAAPSGPSATAAPPAVVVSTPLTAEATVVVLNRPVVTLRAPMFGATPADRARRARTAIAETLALGGPGQVSTEIAPIGTVVKIDGRFAFAVQADDADRTAGQSPEQAVHDAVERLQAVIAATRESRDLSSLLHGLAAAAAATLVAFALLWAVRRGVGILGKRLLRLAGSSAERLRVGRTELLQRERLLQATRFVLDATRWGLVAVVVYEWLGFVLSCFAYTRPWGEQLNGYLLEVIRQVSGAILGAVPDLLIAVLIFVLAWVTARTAGAFLERAAATPDSLSWLDRDTVRPARRLATAAIWLFALAMAYPYLPGSGTEAFKGLSVLVGLMLSLGGSSLVGQAASGLVLMYTRTLRVGEYVSIDGHDGTIVELGTFSTRIRTGRGEELTLPNALVMGTVTRNYSRTVKGHGFVLDTEVTIGYDTPWRQVHQMLIEAAQRTPGVLSEPAPRVFQTALSDFYPQYRLVCQAVPSDPRPRAEVLSALLANIQDVFNENGVQIMSPHYLDDPADPKVVPPSRRDPGLVQPLSPDPTGGSPQPGPAR